MNEKPKITDEQYLSKVYKIEDLEKEIAKLKAELANEKALIEIIDKHLFDSEKENENLNTALELACDDACGFIVDNGNKTTAYYKENYLKQARVHKGDKCD